MTLEDLRILHLYVQAATEECVTGCSLSIYNISKHNYTVNNFLKPTPSRPPFLTVPLLMSQALKHLNLWEPFLFKSPHFPPLLCQHFYNNYLKFLECTIILTGFKCLWRREEFNLYSVRYIEWNRLKSWAGPKCWPCLISTRNLPFNSSMAMFLISNIIQYSQYLRMYISLHYLLLQSARDTRMS